MWYVLNTYYHPPLFSLFVCGLFSPVKHFLRFSFQIMVGWNKLVTNLGTSIADTDFQLLFVMLTKNCIDKIKVSGQVWIGFMAVSHDYEKQ